MKTRNVWCTVGPAPVHTVADIVKQIEDQGWEIKFVAFAGFITEIPKVLMIPKAEAQSFPAYSILSRKTVPVDAEPEFPSIDIPGMRALNPMDLPKEAAGEKHN